MVKTPNAQQNQVINDLENNLILFASAGTGKTFTVANRVANILRQGKAAGEEILCLTFTIKASEEMKEDVLRYVGEEASGVQTYTIHGFCYQLLLEESKRKGGSYADLGVCDEVDQEEILKSVLSSRYYAWKIEQDLAQYSISMPNLDRCEICQIQGKDGLFWRVEDKLVRADGEVYDCAEEVCLPATCPNCEREAQLSSRICENCGYEFSFVPNRKKFAIYDRRSALRNLVSEVKHYREFEGLYSGNDEEDYQRAFNALKEKNSKGYEGLISYFAPYMGAMLDEDFAMAMENFIGRLIAEYDAHLRMSNLLDFDDLILQANAILKTEEGLSYWSKKYKYIVLDEMQDTSLLEYSLLKKLFADNRIMLCGDFFQTIYGWRGSRPQEILDGYIQEFSAVVYTLSENYRATKTLAAASFGYLQNTYPQFLDKYCPSNLDIHSEEEGEKIFCYAFDSPEQEAHQIYRYLQRNKPQNPSDVCIIARSNKYIAGLSSYFESFNAEQEAGNALRFFTVEENFQFFKKAVVKDILAVLKLLVNPFDRVSMERLTEKFVSKVGMKSIEALRQCGEIGVAITSFLEEQTYLHGDAYHHLLEGYTQGHIVVYDTETTGLDLSKDEIVQLSAIKLGADGKIVDTLDIMVEPTVPIDADAYRTHGFDLEYIRAHGGVAAREALGRFFAFTQGCVLVGHNNFAYDRPLLKRQLHENGLSALDIVAEYDTLVVAKQFYPHLENFKLATLCKQFDIVNECAHNALGDITATGKCLLQMIRNKVLPTAMERRALLSKFAPKFEKFYAFMGETATRLQRGEELPAYIIERLRLQKKYPSNADFAAMRDIVESLQIPVDVADKISFLREYLKDAALSGSQMDILLKKLNKIPIITVHQAKGCEFDTVIIAGADDNNFPSFAAKQSGDEEEEKKVFYVAITRAKKRLLLTRSLYSGRYERQETPYFWAIPEEYVRENRAWKNGG